MAFAVIFRSNTHTQPNYRVPLLPQTHDDAGCTKNCCNDPKFMAKVAKVGQRAQREATGYYCGYTFKRQPVGRFALVALGRPRPPLSDPSILNSIAKKNRRLRLTIDCLCSDY